MLKNFLKKVVTLTLVFSMMISYITIPVFAAPVVSKVTFSTNHDGFDKSSAYLEIWGTDLQSASILVRNMNGELFGPSNIEIQTSNVITISFDSEEASDIQGEIMVDGVPIDLELEEFTTINSASEKSINYSNGEDLIIYGNNLDKVKRDSSDTTRDIVASYGNQQYKFFYNDMVSPNSGTQLTIKNPSPGDKGNQTIVFKREVAATATEPVKEITYRYVDCFKLVEDINISDLFAYPNTGAKGDEFYLTGTTFNSTEEYKVYLVKSPENENEFIEDNECNIVSFATDIDSTTEDRLVVTVPNNNNFKIGTYYIVLVKVVGDEEKEIIAEKIVQKQDGTTDEQFTVIGASYKPTIDQVSPVEGPDTGQNVFITGKNLITVNIPSLDTDNKISAEEGLIGDTILKLTYNNGTYDGKEVSIVREVKIQIGKVATFVKSGSNYNITQGVPDQVVVKTATIDDASEDPKKDIQIEIETTLTEVGSANPATYIFSQSVVMEDGYTFIPSTLTPVIDSVTPDKIQTVESGSYNKLRKETLISIKGSNFLVDKVVENDEVIIKKPTIIIKKDDTNLLFNSYQLGFFPNETVNGVTGVIRYKESESDTTSNVVTYNGVPVELDMTVLDDDGNVIDGTDGNDVGTNIIIRISNEAVIKDLGSKHIQLINPRRESDLDGDYAIQSDIIEFVNTSNTPVIESVDPNVVSINGGSEITITGSNFDEGLSLILDGNEIVDFTKEMDSLGSKTIITFTAPKGREGITQLQIVNPDGGMDARDFIYVKSFSDDPEFDNFSPAKGSAGTLVIINGDNFFKPSPTVPDINGVNLYTLIGTRVFVSGKDVNSYNYDIENNIIFRDYTAPSNTHPVITNSSNKAVLSKFKENVVVIENGVADNVALFHLGNDRNGDPTITNYEDQRYSFVYVDDSVPYYKVYDIDGNDLGSASMTTTGNETLITFNDNEGNLKSFTATTDNNIISKKLDEDGSYYVDIADYAESIILNKYNSSNVNGIEGEYYTISKNFDGKIVFSNGSDIAYIIDLDSSGDFVALEENRPSREVLVDENKLTIDGITYKYTTVYEFDNSTHEITGDKTNVITKNQISFIMPSLKTGTGYKDITIVNPDTKEVSKEGSDGFYYITQPSSHPIISEINPNSGSTEGGYIIRILGSGFEDDMKVYIDSVEIPSSDTFVDINGNYVDVEVPTCIKDLQGDYNIDRFTVPVLVMNEDGGSYYKESGFTYFVPSSDPRIDEIILSEGSSNGGEIVEILGYDFRYFEPYIDSVGGSEYNVGDEFTDIYKNNKWDNLLSDSLSEGVLKEIEFSENPYYTTYYSSKILPKVYFGENEAKIVEFGTGILKVITPPHDAGTVDVYVVNNDYGLSNSVDYIYSSSSPVITEISPDRGRRYGQEYKDIYGSGFYRSEIFGYKDDDAATITKLEDVDVVVRFGDIGNDSASRNDSDYGLINSGKAEVNLDGNLKVKYDSGSTDTTLKLFVEENGRIYSREFSGYDDSEVYIPMEMLQNNDGNSLIYYVPDGYDDHDGSKYMDMVFEYVKVYIENRRLVVERGYSPNVTYESSGRVTAMSPSYYTIDTINVYVKNNDGGIGQGTFTYTNPDSKPQILKINPSVYTESVDPNDIEKTIRSYDVEGSIQGGIEIEIIGLDFRTDASVYIGSLEAEVVDTTTTVIDNVTYDLIIAKIPVATTSDIDMRYPIIVENRDSGMATSTTLDNLIGPNYGTETLPYYFVYRKPLSGPGIASVDPVETSVFGGNTVVITGSDFRDGATVIIGSRGGVPIENGVITERGTIITIVTPTNLTIGTKTIQVINEDFGTYSLESGLKVISYPTVETEMFSEDGTISMNTVSVEGGERIMIKGTDFMEGATVIFGGTREEVTYEDKSSGTYENVGLFKDDTYYTVVDGYAATDVTFVDDETLIVTTPLITDEDMFTVTVINSDGGLSDDGTTITYSQPIPTRPIGLRAKVVDDRYIKLYEYISKNVEYYEIYYYLGSKDVSELYNNNYRDVIYIGTTTMEPYKVTRIPNFDERKVNDVLYFVLKAVNKFGVSKWSNFASLSYSQLKDIEEFGPEDYDGEIGVKEGDEYDYSLSTGELIVRLSEKKLSDEVIIDLYGREKNIPGVRKVIVPEEMIKSNNSTVLINYVDSKIRFSPVSLNTAEFRDLEFYDKAYGEIETSNKGDEYSSMLNLSMPRGKKVVSKIYSLKGTIKTNEEESVVDQFSTPIDIQILYNDTYIKDSMEGSLLMYRFDKDSNKWEIIPSSVDAKNNLVSGRTFRPGSYVVLMER